MRILLLNSFFLFITCPTLFGQTCDSTFQKNIEPEKAWLSLNNCHQSLSISIDNRAENFLNASRYFSDKDHLALEQEALDSAIALVNQIKKKSLHFKVILSEAERQRSLGLLSAAKKTILKAEFSLDSLQDQPQLIAHFWGRKAAITNESKGSKKEVLAFSQLSLEYAKKAQDTLAMAGALNEIGFILEHEGDDYGAINNYRKAIDFFQDKGAKNYSINVFRNWIRLLFRSGKYSECIQVCDSAIKSIQEAQQSGIMAPIHGFRSQALFELGYFQKAYMERELYHQLTGQQRHLEWTNQIAEYQSKINLASEQEKHIQEQNRRKSVETALAHQSNFNLVLVGAIIFISILLLGLFFVFQKNRQTGKALAKSNKEKDFLLKEVHHRVKNNLQSLQSLLSIQLSCLEKEEEKDLISSTIRRIEAISYTHHLLYKNDFNIRVNLFDYMQQIKSSMHLISSDKGLDLQFDISPIEVNFDECISMGMIISELVSNSIKYCQNPDQKKATLTISQQEKRVLVHYFDNNKSEVPNSEKNQSLGLQIIRLLIRKLNGKMEPSTTEFGVKFSFERCEN